ncbi:hypothetical protein Nepgr_016211 [Nepenthes gracilis]|uniref:Uncharacterized protein n=1 Tax=Nepenthes gracilis TaxID=150966 RepID=A0AAD3XSB0_NEPGR|nr:hypothetical protein Nepgr_016211 [Nepenthes gracilis]
MMVSGPHAIAIAAALSLAVEGFNFKSFHGTSHDAASLLGQKLGYLASSRPIAVNLSDATTKLKDVKFKAASSRSEAKTVFHAYKESAEMLLEDDVASSRIVGSYGASFIQNKLNDLKTTSILTHCNNASIATVGYGTTLGIIHALHSKGVLERAYCIETRPYNQVNAYLPILLNLFGPSLRYAITDVVVCGAPAIAIAAALSLAVEAFNLESFHGTSHDAASLLGQKIY